MATITFNSGPITSDPYNHPILIIGQVRHLSLIKFADVKDKLEPRVNEQVIELFKSCYFCADFRFIFKIYF